MAGRRRARGASIGFTSRCRRLIRRWKRRGRFWRAGWRTGRCGIYEAARTSGHARAVGGAIYVRGNWGGGDESFVRSRAEQSEFLGATARVVGAGATWADGARGGGYGADFF